MSILSQDLMADSSFFFLNSDPLVDFPRPSAARIIDLGGIAVVNGHNQLDKVVYFISLVKELLLLLEMVGNL